MDPMAQAEVEREIRDLARRLDRVTVDYADMSQTAAEARVAYKLGYAKALLRAQDQKGTVAMKEAWALTEVEEEFARYELADAEAKALQEVARGLRSQLDGLRSINANVRAVVTNS